MKKTLLCIVLVTALLLTGMTLRFNKYYSDACDTYAQTGLKGDLTKEINRSLADSLNYDFKIREISKINYLQNGKISSINIDTTYINLIANELSNKVYECICKTNKEFGVPLGNALGYKLLSGKGPKIDFEVVPAGAVSYEINSELITGGINQTLHRVYIVFSTDIECIAPLYSCESRITNSILISETLIVGEVPEIVIPKN